MNRLKDIKIVFLDIDGTLTTSKKRITLKTKRSIKRIVDKGIYVVLTSGRNCPSAVRFSRKALASPIVICSNGAEIYNYKDNKLLYGSIITYDKLEKIYSFCNENEIKIIFNTIDDAYVNKYMIGQSKIKYKYITDLKELKDLKVIQTTFQIDKKSDMKKCEDYIKNLNLKINYTPKGFITKGFNSIDVNNGEVSKGEAVKNLLQILNIKKEQSLCIGDFINDKSMFNECGTKVAMKNGVEELKEISDYVTLSNDKNGVADFLNKYL